MKRNSVLEEFRVNRLAVIYSRKRYAAEHFEGARMSQSQGIQHWRSQKLCLQGGRSERSRRRLGWGLGGMSPPHPTRTESYRLKPTPFIKRQLVNCSLGLKTDWLKNTGNRVSRSGYRTWTFGLSIRNPLDCNLCYEWSAPQIIPCVWVIPPPWSSFGGCLFHDPCDPVINDPKIPNAWSNHWYG